MKVQRERGAVLIVSLLMLIVLTLLSVSAINTGTVNLRVVGNMQAQTQTELAVQSAVLDFLSDIGNFTTPTSATIAEPGVTVTIDTPVCRQTTPATGYSATWNLVPEDNLWEFKAYVDDGDGPRGAETHVVQGTKIRMVAGSC